MANHIMRSVQVFPDAMDTLIWLPSKTGRYVTKEAYNRFIKNFQEEIPLTDSNFQLWQDLWKVRAPPRVITFIWRCLHNGLPVAKRLSKIFHKTEPLCFRCGQDDETIEHMIFNCPSSRAVWFASELNLRVEVLPQTLGQIITHVMENFQCEQLKMFFSIMWQIWKGRCDLWFRDINFDVVTILNKAKSTIYTDMAGVLQNKRIKDIDLHYNLFQGVVIILVDGSWDMKGRMGLAAVMYDPGGKLYHFHCKGGKAVDSYVAEAEAVLIAIYLIKTVGHIFTSFNIFSDCLPIVNAITNRNLQDFPSWRAEHILRKILIELSSMNQVQIRHARRVAVHPAHLLANQARRGVCYNFCLSPEYHRAPSCFKRI
ncbi:Ribonuclease H-like superfamily protein [Rhynchospora pubera]|uniref:Ribonuclease H-like superfamily protein n=1 Tax=Rhynchospora pubera TaxID=906938 RepID=A0AAV8GG64_9POAL|nr:Ribonuclease H-like superfamily protein [Rhynchospora pubera]